LGKEPSGAQSNEPIFDYKNRPHNAIINSGALMVCSLLIYHGITFPDVISFFEKATNT
jgi:glutaminase